MNTKRRQALLGTLKARFEKHMGRHEGVDWSEVQARLESRPDKLRSLEQMERTGGEPDVVGRFDTKTASWVKTPPAIRKFGGALFCDRRYDHVFVYHNGAQSYYAARGFRGMLKV